MNTNQRILLMGGWLVIGIVLFAWEWMIGAAWILGGFLRPTPQYEEIAFTAGVIDQMKRHTRHNKR